jgi:hypothetical protein
VARSRDPLAAARALRIEKKLLCRRDRLRHRIRKDQATAVFPLLARAATASCSPRRRRS